VRRCTAPHACTRHAKEKSPDHLPNISLPCNPHRRDAGPRGGNGERQSAGGPSTSVDGPSVASHARGPGGGRGWFRRGLAGHVGWFTRRGRLYLSPNSGTGRPGPMTGTCPPEWSPTAVVLLRLRGHLGPGENARREQIQTGARGSGRSTPPSTSKNQCSATSTKHRDVVVPLRLSPSECTVGRLVLLLGDELPAFFTPW
jgi:hypothetical protein